MKNKRLNYLITGGAGFIGSNMTEFLLEKGHAVTVLDDLSTGFEKNLEEFTNHPSFNFIKGSITELDDCLDAVSGKDVVIHMAALGSVPRSIDNPIKTNFVNVDGFVNVLTAAKDSGVKRVVYSSSSSVYGDDKELIKVEDSIGNPLSPYAVSKRANELYASAFQKVYNMEIIGLRYFNVFGPKQNIEGPYAAVIPIFISNLLKGELCSINGDGSITRDFTFVKNVLEANYLASQTTNTEVFGEVFNIAMGGTTTLLELYNALENKIISGLSPTFSPPRKGDILKSLANTKKAEHMLNYVPKHELKSSLNKTIDWYKNELT